ncbi:MAG TPA: DUF177 domain-containing protein [Pyrinomonadaceae bacterium]
MPFSFSIQPAEIDLENDGVNLKSAVLVEGELKKGIVQTDVSGTISALTLVECTRCLTEIEQNLEFSFDATFVFPENFTEAKEAELKDADLNVSILETSEIDLSELAREQILLNLPEQVLCTEDCKGLCEKCGANRNLINCNCEEKEIDPRWSALKNLKS